MKRDALPEVLDLFGNDPLCRWMIWFYRLHFPIYAIFWVVVMVGLPLLIALIFGSKWIEDFLDSVKAVGILQAEGSKTLLNYLARGLFPLIGAAFGYRWFAAIAMLPAKLKEKGLLAKSASFSTTRSLMSGPMSYLFAAAAVIGIAYAVYGSFRISAENWAVLIGSLVWWYFLIRIAEMAVFHFQDLHRFLHRDFSKEGLSMTDPANAFGLRPLIDYVSRFLWLYILIIGTYLVFYKLVLADVPLVFTLLVWGVYFALPIYGYRCSLGPADRLLQERKHEMLATYSQKMDYHEKNNDLERWQHYRTLYNDLNKPFGIRKLVTFQGVQLICGLLNLLIAGAKPIAEWFSSAPPIGI
ncbi:MAG: hypothetical protein QNK37_30055 [Acidobacteriota bacterium]|nr:hypothetical protein [Acidobacteriota bacterium]